MPVLGAETVGVAVGVGVYVNLGRDGSGAADVAGCDGDRFALAGLAEEGTGAGGAGLVVTTLVVGCAPVGRPPAGSLPVGTVPPVAVPDDWLDCPD